MPFGYSSKIFPHPAVEYIPLLPLKSLVVKNPDSCNSPNIPDLHIFTENNQEKFLPLINHLSELNLNPDEELGLILENCSLEIIKYRGNYITIIVQPAQCQLQIIKILHKYFYKEDLIFQLVDPSSGKIYCQKRLPLSNIR